MQSVTSTPRVWPPGTTHPPVKGPYLAPVLCGLAAARDRAQSCMPKGGFGFAIHPLSV